MVSCWDQLVASGAFGDIGIGAFVIIESSFFRVSDLVVALE